MAGTSKLDLSWLDLVPLTDEQEGFVRQFNVWHTMKYATPEEMIANFILEDSENIDKLLGDKDYLEALFLATHTADPFVSCRKRGFHSLGMYLEQFIMAINELYVKMGSKGLRRLTIGQVAFLVSIMVKHDAAGVLRDGITSVDDRQYYLTIDLDFFDTFMIERIGMPKEVSVARIAMAPKLFESDYMDQLAWEYKRCFPNKIQALQFCGIRPMDVGAMLVDPDTTSVFSYVDQTFISNTQRDVLRAGSYKDSKQILKELGDNMKSGASGADAAMAAARSDSKNSIVGSRGRGKRSEQLLEDIAAREDDTQWRDDAQGLEERLVGVPEDEPLPMDILPAPGVM